MSEVSLHTLGSRMSPPAGHGLLPTRSTPTSHTGPASCSRVLHSSHATMSLPQQLAYRQKTRSAEQRWCCNVHGRRDRVQTLLRSNNCEECGEVFADVPTKWTEGKSQSEHSKKIAGRLLCSDCLSELTLSNMSQACMEEHDKQFGDDHPF